LITNSASFIVVVAVVLSIVYVNGGYSDGGGSGRGVGDGV
jgi:hypothetical protein